MMTNAFNDVEEQNVTSEQVMDHSVETHCYCDDQEAKFFQDHGCCEYCFYIG